VIVAEREDISGLSDFRRISQELTPGTRIQQSLARLTETDSLEQFMSNSALSPSDRRRYSTILHIPPEEIPSYRAFLRRRISSESDLPSSPRIALERALAQDLPGRILYLPTFRRIEKDLRDVFPDFEERFRQYSGSALTLPAGRSASHYIELVSFGMEDVRKNIANRMEDVKNYSLKQCNALSANYLRDVIRGQADQFNTEELNTLTEDDIARILARVSETALSREDKALVQSKIKMIQGKRKPSIPKSDRFLAHYFTRLVGVPRRYRKERRGYFFFCFGVQRIS
jgi:hypothetical protein